MKATPLTLLLGAVLAASVPAFAAAKTTGTWKAPDLAPASYAKVAVLAKISDEAARRQLEDRVAAGLEQRGIEAIPAHSSFTAENLASEETVRARAKELGVDAGLVFTVTGEQTQVQQGPTVHASIGVPVHMGGFSLMVGGSVPLGGGSTTKVVGLKSEFITSSGDGPRWAATYATDLRNGSERAAHEVATQALKQLKKSGLFE
jgi:hypothetical protein